MPKNYTEGISDPIFKEGPVAVQSRSLSFTASQSSYLIGSMALPTAESNTNAQTAADKGSSGSLTNLPYENYSSQGLSINYSNGDGDTLSLSAGAVSLQSAVSAANNDPTDDGWKKIIADIKDEYEKMKSSIVNTLFGQNQTGTHQTAANLKDPRSFDETTAIPGLPDYWNADNTSQRIVDFATSFLSAFKGSGSQFVDTIKNAIDQGFSQAEGVLGNTPDAVDKLTAKTHALVMDKIDQWAKDQGIVTDDSQDPQESEQPA